MRAFFLCLFLGATGLAVIGGTALAGETTNDIHELNIPQAPLGAALAEFTRQTHWPTESMGTLPVETLVGPVQGSYTAAAALERLLVSTGLGFTQKKQSFLISPQPSRAVAPTPAPTPHPTSVTPAATPTNDEPPVVVSAPRQHQGLQAPEPTLSLKFTLDEQDIEWRNPSQVGNLLSGFSQQLFNMNRRADGAQIPEFRGLSNGATQVTINGRRAQSTIGETLSSFDVGLVPVAALAKLEVILEPTDVQLGVPVGGNVNLVLKRMIPQTTVELLYGGAEGGSDERRLGLATGIERGRVNGSLVLEHFDRDPLYGSDRDRWRNQDFRRYDGRDYRVGTARASLNSYYTAMPEFDQNSLVALGEFEIDEGLTLFGEGMITDRSVTQEFSPPMVTQMVPGTNAFNTSGQPTFVDTLFTHEQARERETQSEWLRAVIGLKGQWWSSWTWEVAAAGTRDNAIVTSANDLNPEGLTAALAERDPALALNPFDPDAPGNQAVFDRIRAPRGRTNFQSDTSTLTATTRGKFYIGNREFSALLGLEWERNEISISHWRPLERTTYSAFAQMGVPLSKSTALSVGSRFDRVSEIGTLSSPQLAFNWRAFKSLDAYASLGWSERPATVVDLYQPTTILQSVAFDPARQLVNRVDVTVGGNPDLAPVTARIFATGVRYQRESSWLRAMGMKHWRIYLDDRITVPAVSFLLGYEALYRERITRDASGMLQAVDISRINGGPLDTSGVDLETSLAFGPFRARFDVTRFDGYSSIEVRGLSRVERVGLASSYGTIPRWRAVASLSYERPFGTVVATVRHVPGYEDAIIERTGHSIDAQTLLDLKVVINLGRILDRSTVQERCKLIVGVENVLDEAAHFAEVGMSAGYDMSLGDLRQRFGSAKVSCGF